MDGNLIVALTDVPKDLNPYKSNTLHIHTVIWSIYEPLFDIGHDGQLIPRLAERWDVSSDGRTYRFILRQGVKFHGAGGAGNSFTADSVARSLQQRRNRSSFRERILDDLVADVKPDHYEVTIQLRYPKPELLFLALMTDTGRPPLGTGPFYLAESDQPGTFVLKRNDRYHIKPNLAQITFVDFRHKDAIDELNAGRVDFIRDVDPDRVDEIAPEQIQTVRPFGLHYLGLNLNGTVFEDREVRQALRDIIDFQKIESETGLGRANGPIPPGVEAYDRRPRQQDRAGARRLLKNKFRGESVTLAFNGNSYYGLELASCVAHDLAGSRVNVKVERHGTSTELIEAIQTDGRTDNYAAIYNIYSIVPAAEIFLRPPFESGPDNLTHYAGIDGLFNTQNPISEKALIRRYHEVQQTIVQDVPAIFLGHSKIRFSAHSARVTGLKLNTQSFPVDRYVGVDVP